MGLSKVQKKVNDELHKLQSTDEVARYASYIGFNHPEGEVLLEIYDLENSDNLFAPPQNVVDYVFYEIDGWVQEAAPEFSHLIFKLHPNIQPAPEQVSFPPPEAEIT